MKLNKIFLTASLLAGGLFANAQEEVTEYVFQPNWYIQAQVGGQETLGEGPFGDLFQPNVQLTVGHNFNPYIGARLAINAWSSKGTSKIFENRYKWRWNYVAPTVDAVFNMTNILGGYNPERLVEVDLIGGIGVNVAWGNDQAKAANDAYMAMSGLPNSRENYMLKNLWDGTKARFVGQFGFDVNFNVAKQVQVGLELMANVLPDGYNSKKAGNADWYFNGLVGVKYTFGPTYTKNVKTINVPCEPQIVEKVVEKIVEKRVEVPVPAKEDQMRRDVFFKINRSVISNTEMAKVQAVADYMKAHPNRKVVVTGYADKGTGTLSFNLRLSAKRAQAVANALVKKYGIEKDRIIVKSMGEALDQPFPDPVQNRVAICIVD